MSQAAQSAPPDEAATDDFAALQWEFNAFLAELEQVGKQIAWRMAEGKESQAAEVSFR